jgi:hypothetical protein
MLKQILDGLQKPVPYQWRVQSYSKNKPLAICVAYLDARQVAKILDTHCSEGWQDTYREIGGVLFCGISVKIAGEWLTRWDCGVESKVEKEKGEASDSFKRAAVKWGVGRFLYDLGIKYVPTTEVKTAMNYPKFVDSKGNQHKDLNDAIEQKKEITPNQRLWGTALGRFSPYVEGEAEGKAVAKFFLERSAEKINGAKNPIDQPEKLSSVSALSDIEKMNLVAILKEMKPVQLQGAVYDYRLSLNVGKVVEYDFQEGIAEPVGRRKN